MPSRTLLMDTNALRLAAPICTMRRSIVSIGLCISVMLLTISIASAWENPKDTDAASAKVASTVSYINDVVPILTKTGCNAGTCHAKATQGQNGFYLSLLGFEPQDDYFHLTLEGRGRRIALAAPEQSLLLRKATGSIPHGGGVRFDSLSPHYDQLRRWIEQGAIYDGATAPALHALEVQPQRGVLAPGSQQQLQAWASYSDGSRRDVTHLALFESNDVSMADVDRLGLVQCEHLPGKVSIMVRFQGVVSVYNASVPQRAKVENLPAARTALDTAVFSNLVDLGIPPSTICDDATFLRRVSLDIAGRLPTLAETTAFESSNAPDKRDQAIERLLQSSEYADYFANKWTAMLKNRRDDTSDITSNFAFHSWIRDGLLTNKPYDAMVRELLAATGTVMTNPPVAWYKRVKDPKQQLEDVAQLFLGVRMQCAQCHHHPFERWSQDDYYSLAAFFSQVGRKPTSTRGEDMIFHKRGLAGVPNAKTGQMRRPAALGQPEQPIAPDQDPRLLLADWMSDRSNPFFAKALVNRYWKHFFRRGLIEPEDDIRDSNPPSNPELLAALESHFIASGFDLKELVRVITRSQAYQLSAEPNENNAQDQQNYSRYYPRRLQAEVLLDAMDDLFGTRTEFPNLPSGTRAVALPDNSYNNASPFLKVFGRPENESVCECERVQSSSLAQSLHLMNSQDLKGKLASPNGRITKWLNEKTDSDAIIREAYRIAFARPPSTDESRTAKDYLLQARFDPAGNPIDAQQSLRENLQDLLWALINTKEFLFNH